MTQQPNQASPTRCLKDKLANSEQKANEAEFHKQTAATLKDLIAKSETELNKYRDALPVLLTTWKDQDEKLKELKRHLETCYPEWECYLRKSVCVDVICKNWQLKQSYESKLGAPELRLQYASADKAKATEQLEAWKAISTWITKRLSDNKSLYDRICAIDNCKTPLLQLYLFYFILWPQHRQLCNSPRQLDDKREVCPAYAYCSGECQPPVNHCTCLIGYPWIIDPENFDCQLTNVWQAWSDAGIKEAKARSAYEQIAKDKEEYIKASTPEALEKAAKEALGRFDKLEIKPCPEEKDPCETEEKEYPCNPQPDYSKDPCKIDPCKLDEEGNDGGGVAAEDPCAMDAPSGCEEPEPCVEPAPETDPCQETESGSEGKNPADYKQQQAVPPKGETAS
jgi:hypothetical protein